MLPWLLAMLVAAPAHAETASEGAPTRDEQAWQSLETLVETIQTTREHLAEGREALAAASGAERAQLAIEVEHLAMDLESLQTAWEMLATGGADLRLFGVRTETSFDWREEFQSVLEPILVELRRLTERPRKMERLRNDQAYYRERLDVAEQALQSIVANREAAPTEALRRAFGGLEQRWQARRDEFRRRVDLASYELQLLMEPPAERGRDPMEALQALLSGRVLNLLMAVAAMVTVFMVMRLLSNVYERRVMRRARMRGAFAARVGHLMFYLLTAVLVLGAGMLVLYIRGDWLLLGLLLIILASAGLLLQRSLPRFVAETRMMLNLGPVREGERLVYNGLPWLVKTLTFQALLVNPRLQGGVLRVPVRDLLGIQSRGFDESEPWFVSAIGDYVKLDDGTYGKVLAQTPEGVQLQTLGAVTHYRAGAFLDHNPQNLSQEGFTLVITFGLDYACQAQIVDGVPQAMEAHLRRTLEAAGVADLLAQLSVEFAQAGASSLDLAIIAGFRGAAADRYFGLRRLLQRGAVEACNHHGWSIPFSQLTVHMAQASAGD